MITDLFAATYRLDASLVTRAIPPACRREPAVASVVSMNERESLLEFPEWQPRVAARHLVPSLSALTDVPYAVRFELSAWIGGAWSPWVATATIGPGRFSPLSSKADLIACDVDVYTTSVSCERLRLRIRLGAADVRALTTAPWLATLSASDLAPTASEPSVVRTRRLCVPALSQLDATPEIALRICSPSSVAMVLAYWGVPVAPATLAEEIYHPDTDRYGVWPAAIRAAGRRGVAGYLLRFPDWSSAAWCLERRLPIVASVRYTAGELTGAALAETSGHLIVLTGSDGIHVDVNDPVAPTASDVRRRYRLDELQRVWLDRTGIGYVLFHPDHLPALD